MFSDIETSLCLSELEIYITKIHIVVENRSWHGSVGEEGNNSNSCQIPFWRGYLRSVRQSLSLNMRQGMSNETELKRNQVLEFFRAVTSEARIP